MAGRGGGNPISFKTVPNRNKTQKWQQAKTYNYDGDDWGGYDPYDEYAYDDKPMPPMPQPQQRPPPQLAQPPGYGRSLPRTNSFDQGDERRNFSAGPVMYGSENRSSGSPARSNVSGGDYNDGRPRSRPRDFTNPEQVPPPLAMRGSPAQGSFPPRKSSISSGSPAPEVAPMPAVKKEEKELPIPPVIRPSDIYKRMEAEREKERQSMEGSRPSMDTLQKEAQAQGRPLSSVQEDFGEPLKKDNNARPPMLPSVRNMSGIGTSFLHSSSEVEQPTRAPEGKDPAAEILAERAETRAPPGADPAGEILAERTATRAPPGSDPAADILAERTATRAQPGSDPAADILAERGHQSAAPEPESGVDHHYRSMVDQAFDNDSAKNSNSLSRDSSVYSQSVGGGDMSRNNSSSTSNISPIMSRVPSAATAKMQQQERDRKVPTIAEEPTQRATPGHSRNVSAGSSELVQPGYRRSLDPPSGDNSPARTPGLENAHSRRLSQPMSAVEGSVEPPAVPDQGVEMMPGLEPGETPASEVPTPAAVPIAGRSRSGTDYSMRESDMAREVSTSPEKNEFSPTIAEAAAAEQAAFLQDHSGTPTSAWPPTASGRSSPAKSRVREIAGKYQTIEAESRRGSTASSKSSWSNFRGSNEDLPGGLKKRPTGESALGAEVAPAASETRPQPTSQMSFRPGLPGQWVSYAPTPATETPAPIEGQPTSREPPSLQTTQEDDETPDFSPTTDKHKLQGKTPEQQGLLTQAKGVGEAIGASLMSTVGVGHQTRDFASTEPAAPVELPRHRPTGEMGGFSGPERPDFNRGDTEASMATDIASSASSVPPTPPVKDGVGAQHGQAPRQLAVDQDNRPISNYFSGAVAPLQPSRGHTREASAGLNLPKLGPMTNMSTDTREEDMESDRLRREIVRSLSPTTSREDNAALTQDALDAPDNMRKVEAGQAPDAPAESGERPGLGLLNQRFSWEERAEPKGILDSSPAAARTRDMPTVREPEPDPEIKPEMPYERPRSRGLHIVNSEGADSSDDDDLPVQQTPKRDLVPEDKSIVSPLTPSQENLREGLDSRDISRDDMSAAAPRASPGLEVVDSRDSDGGARVPSYYVQGGGQPTDLDMPKSPSLTQHSPIPEPASPTSPQTAIADSSPASPSAPTTAAATAVADKPRNASTSAAGGKIPPFREILATKDARRRMDMYTTTRQTFADSHTGLSGWVEGMLERSPEYAHLGTSMQPSGTSGGAGLAPMKTSTGGIAGLGGHKHSPSLAKFKSLGSTFGTSDSAGSGGIRRSSTTRDVSGGSNGQGGGANAPPLPPKDGNAAWEQRGKELMKGAGVLGGKAQAGAKGLLKKGRGRFGTTRRESGTGGGDKALPPLPPSRSATSTPISYASTPPPPTSSSTPPVPDLPPFQTAATTSATPPLPPPSRSATSTPRLQHLRSQTSTSLSASASGASTPSHSRAPSRTGSTLRRTWSRLRSSAGGSRSRDATPSGVGVAARSEEEGRDPEEVGGGAEVGSETGRRGLRDRDMQAASPLAITAAVAVPAGAAKVVNSHAAAGRDGDDAAADIAPWDRFGSRNTDGEDEEGKRTEHERLGILPSPTATAYSTAAMDGGGSPTKTVRSRQGSVAAIVAGGRSRQGSRVDGTIREHGFGDASPLRAEDSDDIVTPRKQRGSDGVYEALERGWGGGTSDEESEVGAAGGEGGLRRGEEVEERRVGSARAWLPSQLKAGSAPQSPGGVQEEELYESTPTQGRFDRSMGGIEGGRGAVIGIGGSRDGDVFDDRTEAPNEQVSGQRDIGGAEQAIPLAKAESIAGPAAELQDMARQATNEARYVEDSSMGQAVVGAPLPTQDRDDVRSEISSEDHFHDAKEGNETDTSRPMHSRHSSVSSLGHTADAEEAMSAQAVPAGPLGTLQRGEPAFDQPRQGFMDRSYRAGAERPMSYFPLGTTTGGAPVQETLDDRSPPEVLPVDLSGMSGPPLQERGSGPENPSVDISGMSGPPTGVQPYEKHPAMRGAEGGFDAGLPGDHGGLKAPPPIPDANPLTAAVASAVRPTPRNRQVSAEIRQKSSSRVSGLFRSRRPSEAAPTTVYGPAPSAISDQYGLESLPTGSAAVARPDTGEAQQAKRRSGIWNNFKRSSVALPGDSRQSSVAALPSQLDVTDDTMRRPQEPDPVRPSASRVNTLKKAPQATAPQRATTSATPPDPAKKKRFSAFGSLFGRSSTTGHKAERPKRLTKAQPPSSREASSTYIPPTSSVATGYEAYEAERRRQAREQRAHQRVRSPQIGPPQQERADLTTAAIDFPSQGYAAPPPGGWYAPGQEHDAAAPQHQHRVLHSERERPDLHLGEVPQAFQPTDAGFGRPVAPVGPPVSQAEGQMPMRVRSPSAGYGGLPWTGDVSYAGGQRYYQPPGSALSQQQRHGSYDSTGQQFSPQVCAPMQYEQQDWQQQQQYRGPSPSISPVHSRTGSENFSMPRQTRVGSIGQEMARSPPSPSTQQQQQHGYIDPHQQQRPWAVSMPSDGVRRYVSHADHRTQGAGNDCPPYGQEPVDDYRYALGPYPAMSMPKQRAPPGQQRQAWPAPQAQAPYHYTQTAPGAPSFPPHTQHPQHQQHPHPPPQQQQRISSLPPHGSSPHHERQYSGPVPRPATAEYLGRRGEEPALGEMTMDLRDQMRGASYPGMEWAPGGR